MLFLIVDELVETVVAEEILQPRECFLLLDKFKEQRLPSVESIPRNYLHLDFGLADQNGEGLITRVIDYVNRLLAL